MIAPVTVVHISLVIFDSHISTLVHGGGYLDQNAVGVADIGHGLRSVEPVGFFRGGIGWFLIAHCRLRGGGRIFRLDRIKLANLTKQTFEPHDVDECLGWTPYDLEQP